MSNNNEYAETEVTPLNIARNMMAAGNLGAYLTDADLLRKLEDRELKTAFFLTESLYDYLLDTLPLTSEEEYETFIRGAIKAVIEAVPAIEQLEKAKAMKKHKRTEIYREIKSFGNDQSKRGVIMAFTGALFILEVIGTATKDVGEADGFDLAELRTKSEGDMHFHSLLVMNVALALPLALSCAKALSKFTADQIDKAVAAEVANYGQMLEEIAQ